MCLEYLTCILMDTQDDPLSYRKEVRYISCDRMDTKEVISILENQVGHKRTNSEWLGMAGESLNES